MKFKFPEHKQKFVKRITWVKNILSSFISVPPSEIIFNYNKFGKPRIHPTKNIDFNYSHSGDYVMLVVSTSHRVGCDIEFVDAKVEVANICEQFFSPSEVSAFRKYDKKNQHQIFFNLWSRKEAFIKAQGIGLSYGLSNFSVDEGNMLYPDVYEANDKNAYKVYSPELVEDYKTAVVIIESN